MTHEAIKHLQILGALRDQLCGKGRTLTQEYETTNQSKVKEKVLLADIEKTSFQIEALNFAIKELKCKSKS